MRKTILTFLLIFLSTRLGSMQEELGKSFKDSFLTQGGTSIKNPQVLSIEKVLELAEINSPRLTAAQFQELSAQKEVNIAESQYFPKARVESICTGGLPGSSSRILDVDGIIGSPFREYGNVGITAKQVILDFGRTKHAINAALEKVEATKQNTRISMYEVKLLALKKFYECSLYRTQKDLWSFLGQESNVITKEVYKFVKTGQRSIVDRYLSNFQTEEAHGFHDYYNARYKQTLRELAIIMRIPEQNLSCPAIHTVLSRDLLGKCELRNDLENSPFFAKAVVESRYAAEKLKEVRSELNPEITAYGSAGYLTKTRLVTKKNYAYGIGVTMPLFDMGIYGRIQRAAAIDAEKKIKIEAEMQSLMEMNAQYDEIIQSTEVYLKRLETQLKIADEGFIIAKKRYFNLQGELVDLREAFRNLGQINSDIENARAKLLQAKGAKFLLNGSM